MSTHTRFILIGTLWTVPLSLQCGHSEIDVPCGDVPEQVPAPSKQKLEELGKQVFWDNISDPPRMACVTCHDPSAGWTFKHAQTNKHQVAVTGANPHTTGSLKPPTNAYAHKTGPFTDCESPPTRLCGGVFWDGRAEGDDKPGGPGATAHVGDEVFESKKGYDLKALYAGFIGALTDQALNPFPNPVEQNIARKQVCEHVASSKYAPLYALAWGEPIDCSDAKYGSKGFPAYEISYRRIGMAIAAWESSSEVNSFSSKRDMALAAEKDKAFPLVGFTEQENLGYELFLANCAFCHTDKPLADANGPADDGTEPFQLYSDDSYHNIGTPKNPEIPGYPEASPGLAGHTGDPKHVGAHKTPTLRNVDKRPTPGFVKAYTHNGWFKSLESLVHFYNTSDVDEDPDKSGATAKSFGITQCKKDMTEAQALAANCWPAPEHTANSAVGIIIGDMGMSLEEEAALVAYLKTLTDTKTVKPPKPYK